MLVNSDLKILAERYLGPDFEIYENSYSHSYGKVYTVAFKVNGTPPVANPIPMSEHFVKELELTLMNTPLLTSFKSVYDRTIEAKDKEIEMLYSKLESLLKANFVEESEKLSKESILDKISKLELK